jgi:hypothetical protein
MKLRCKDGDFALVIHDDLECAANIGRVVRVRGPVLPSRHYGALPTWLIFPTARIDWRIANRNGGSYGQRIESGDRIEHPDAWLLTIADMPKDLADTISNEHPMPVVNDAVLQEKITEHAAGVHLIQNIQRVTPEGSIRSCRDRSNCP